ncbi:MAG TPA: FtsX-like permease family protein, partial [Elusimicrobiota bacterium]|nr:FtsX-like permease family protein [Elusimicrobiota bacterium]
LTSAVAAKLFPSSQALDATIDFQGVSMTVIGIVDWTEATSQRTSAQETDILVPYPWTLSQENLFLSMLEVRLQPQISSERAIATVREIMSHGDANRANMYFVRSMEQIVQQGQKSNDRVTASLLGIAAISLLVGGIGVANVMVTSVTERTREVGIRKALGATRRDIVMQFLIESAVLSGCGGFLAVASGLFVVGVAPSFFDLPFPMAMALIPILSCLVITVAIGLIAGVYPASRAASLSPSEALRYE